MSERLGIPKSQPTKAELRFVDTEQGTHFAWGKAEHDRQTMFDVLLVLVGAFTISLAVVGALTGGGLLFLLGFAGIPAGGGAILLLLASILMGLLCIGVVIGAASKRGLYTHVTYDADGIDVAELKIGLTENLDQPSVDRLREVGIPEGDRLRYPYVDIESMGVTDYSFWFQTDDSERVEWRLDRFSRDEIARIHQAIEPHWRAKRERSIEASKKQLAALQAMRQ